MLLLCAPLGILAAKLNWGPIAVFCLNFGALVPLALILGEVSTACTVSAGLQVVKGHSSLRIGKCCYDRGWSWPSGVCLRVLADLCMRVMSRC